MTEENAETCTPGLLADALAVWRLLIAIFVSDNCHFV
jgi:hypothetical protein